MALWRRLIDTFRRDRVIDELDAEQEAHIADAIADGRDPAEARRAFGFALQQREASRDLRRVGWLDDAMVDLRYAVRTLARQPAFLLVAVLSLGLGIGANTAMFTLIHAALLRPLDVPRANELVLVRGQAATASNLSFPDYSALREHTRTLSTLVAGSSLRPVTLGAGGDVERAFAQAVSDNYFTGLGVAPIAGRAIGAGDDDQQIVVLSRRYWRRRFNEDPGAVGRQVQISGSPFTVVGVADFAGDTPGESPDIWTSMALVPADARGERGFTWLYPIGRLRPGVTIAQAQADLDALAAASGPGRSTPPRVVVSAGAQGSSEVRDRFAKVLWLLLATSGIVLLIACTNLACLLLTRGTSRAWEISMRLAIGASRWRIVRQLLTESLVIAAAGGVAGLSFAMWVSRALVQLVIVNGTALELDLSPNLTVLAFTAGVSVLTGLAFGLAPAWRSVSRHGTAIASHRQASAGGRSRLQHALLVVQIGLSFVLLAGGVMFIRTLTHLTGQDLGFRPSGVLLADLTADRDYKPNLPAVISALTTRARAIPGVESVTVAFGGTLGTVGGVRGLEMPGEPRDAADKQAAADWVGPDYFRTAGISLVAGRDFASSDGPDAERVAVINETAARHYFGRAPAVGQSFTFNKRQYEIVGVAHDAKYRTLREPSPPRVVYFSILQGGGSLHALEVRTAGADPMSMASAVRAAVREADPRLNVSRVATLGDRIDQTLNGERVVASLSTAFGVLTLVLVSIGVYGTLAFTAATRTREVGIRLALGADRMAVIWTLARNMFLVVLAGLAIGIAGVALVGPLITSLLFELQPTDAVTILSAVAVLLGVAGIAAALPAARTSRLDPASVLRE